MRDCLVCRGSQRVRLSLWHPVEADLSAVPDIDVRESSREFPCPECVEQIPYNRLGILKEFAASEVRSVLDEATIIDLQKRQAAHAIADRLVKDDMLRVEKEPTVRGWRLRITLGVVAPSHVATFEDRVNARQFEIAEELVTENVKEIEHWGSFYGIQTVGKWQAIEWMQAALKKIRERHSAARGK